MATYRVTALLLNVRTSPVSNTGDKSNISTQVKQGFEFNSINTVTNAMGQWYQDARQLWYWGGGVTPVTAAEVTPVTLPVTECARYPWWISDYGIDAIWNATKGENVKIAVLDSGYNVNVPDLDNGVVASEVFVNAAGVTINDTFGHGSHCASLAANRNIANVLGYAPAAELYIAKISMDGSIDDFSVLTNAIQWAISNKVDVISISYGGESADAALQQAITTAVDNNIVVVASIGDVVQYSTNRPCYPALYPNCIAVGATNAQKQLSPITIVANKTEINAPGDAVSGYWLSNTPQQETGTSQAAALVAGLCALIISRYKALGIQYSVSTVRELLVTHYQPVSGNGTQKLINPAAIFSNITNASIT